MDNLLALPIGTELAGDYRISRVLGAGGFGITYLAEETPLNRGVAIKEYFPSDFAAREKSTLVRSKSRGMEEDYRWGLDRFIEEAQALATFDHANIVRVYRYFRQNNTGYMVLKLEDGRSFKAWLDQLHRRPRQEELDAIVAPLLDALELIHASSFLHRDIAPDNIMIRPDGSPVLIDFGSARREMATHLSVMSVLVKPGYSPAEQYAQDARRQGPWTDIYALAATLYHAVAGKRPADSPGRMQHDDLEPAVVAAAQGHYRQAFLQAIDAALRLAIETRPQSIAEWRPMLLDVTAVTKAGARNVRLAQAPKTAAQTRKLDGDELKPIRLKPKRQSATPEVIAAIPAKPAAKAAAAESKQRPVARPIEAAKMTILPPAVKPQLADFIRALTPIAGAALANAKTGAQEAFKWLQQAMPRRVEDPVPRPRPRGLIERLAEAKPEETPTEASTTGAQAKPARSSDVATRLIRPAVGQTKDPQAKAPVLQLPQASPAARSRRSWLTRLLPDHLSAKLRGLLIRVAAAAAVGTFVVSLVAWAPRLGLTVPSPSALIGSTDVSFIRALRGHAVSVDALAVSGDGAFIASAGTDGQILIWDGVTGEQRRSIAAAAIPVTALASSEHVVLAGMADGSLGLWQMETGEKLGQFDEHEGPIWAATFLGSSKLFATAGQDTKVRLWDGARGVRNTWYDHKKPVFAVAYSAARRLLATAGADKTVKLWDERRRRLIRSYTGHTEDVRALAMSPDGQVMASAGDDKTIILWPTTSDAPLHTLTGHTNRVNALAFSPDGRMLASGSEDGTVRLWDAASGALLNTYEGHISAVRAVAFLPDGHRIASSGEDLTVRLWNARIAGFP